MAVPSAASPPRRRTPTSSCSMPTRRTSPRCATPASSMSEEGAERTAVLDAVASRRRARGRVRLRAGRGQVAAAPRRARAAGRARRDRRVRLDGQRADPGPHGGHRRRRATCSRASSSGAARTSGRAGSCATRSAATWSASSTGRSPSARSALAAALEPVGHTRVTDNVRGMIWSKLLINTHVHRALGGLRPALRRRRPSRGRDAVFALWAEGVAVGDAQGLKLESIHDVDPHEFDQAALATDDGAHGQRAALDAAGPRCRARHRGRRRQRRRRRARAASSASRRRATTPWSSSCTRWSAASAPPTRAGWPTSATRRRPARPTPECPAVT